MSFEREINSEYPYPCPGCGANLERQGSIDTLIHLPEHSVGHIEPGTVEDEVYYIFDYMEDLPPMGLQCSNCGEALEDLVIEDAFIDPDCEFAEEEEQLVRKSSHPAS